MSKIGITIIISIALTAISLCFLTKYMIDQSEQLSQSSKLKLSCLLLEHFFIIYMIARLVDCDSTEEYVNWMTLLAAVIFVGVSITQIIDTLIHRKFMFLNALRSKADPLDRVYLSLWLNVYFETWLYSFTCLSILCCTYSFTKIGQYCKQRRKKVFLERALKTISINEIGDQYVCPICLLDYEQQQKIVMAITCHHKFHEQCLMGWLQQQNSCPLCREVFY